MVDHTVNGTPMTTILSTVDDLLRARAAEEDQRPVVAYPKSNHGHNDHELFTAKQLHHFTNAAVRSCVASDICPVFHDNPPVLALLGISDLDYLITMLALTRLGYSVLILSPRLSVEAYLLLLDKTGCKGIVNGVSFKSIVDTLQQQTTIERFAIIQRCHYDKDDGVSMPEADYQYKIDRESASSRVAYIMHSSGSTGLPKPIWQTHKACLENYSFGNGRRGFCTAPFYHTHGHASLYRTLYAHGTIFLCNAHVPLTSTNLITAMEEIKPQIILAVPYTLKLLAESDRGVKSLCACEVVSSSGSQCPDELGDRLVAEGVNLVSIYGATETGILMNSSLRPHNDKAWNFLRLIPSVKQYIVMRPLDASTYELIVLDGLPAKVVSNSDDPPKSFHTKDIFTPHPTIPDAWKYLGRLDDRITLMNGEKVLPLPIEGNIRQHPLVREAVLFGIGRDVPGLLLFRSEQSRHLSDEEYVAVVWPSIEEANIKAEAFSQIARGLIVVLAADTDYPRTDKGNIVRAQVYRTFTNVIHEAYETLKKEISQSNVVADIHHITGFLRGELSRLGIAADNDNADLFTAGLDSLKAIQLAGSIKRQFSFGHHVAKIDQNLVYDQGSIRRLARHIHSLQFGIATDDELNEIDATSAMIDKYSDFTPHKPQGIGSPCKIALLTGSTGSLGLHVLERLLYQEDIKTVFCLVRASSQAAASRRVFTALQANFSSALSQHKHKIRTFAGDISRDDLGLESAVLEEVKANLSLVIHCAWTVNFNLGVRSFEEQHILGTRNLIQLCLAVRRSSPARFVFCSSISAALGSPRNSPVLEEPITDPRYAQNTGYGRSKYVAEQLVKRASDQGADSCILRIGQIVGDTKMGIWNTSEAIPLMIQTADTLRCLPALNLACSWLPVDTVAEIVLELASAASKSDKRLVYNVLNPETFSWSQELLPALRAAGLNFEVVAPQEWVRRLQTGDQDPGRNPPVKLAGYFAQKYGSESKDKVEELTFSTVWAEKESHTLRHVSDPVQEGYIGKFVRAWQREWALHA